MTRSVPLMMNVPFSVSMGISPKYTSCCLMSRMLRVPVSGSLSQTTRRMVTLRGTVKFIPRSWHSGTSYLNFRATGSPQ
jgi:hypothetical protein